MDPIVSAIVGAAAGAIASAAATFAVTRYTIQKNLEVKYDADLRRLRLDSYSQLWRLLEPLALFARNGNPGRQPLSELTHALTQWYFTKGGIYLSERTRDAYFRLQRVLRDILASPRWTRPDDRLDDETFEHLRRIGSRLRTQTTFDVGTRKAFMFDPKATETEPSIAPPDQPDDEDEGWILAHVKAGADALPQSENAHAT